MQRPISIAWIATAVILAFPWAAFAQDDAREAMSAQSESLQSSIDVQLRINDLDEQTREMLNE